MLLDMSKYLVDPKLLQTNEDKEKADKAAPQTEKKDEKSKKEKKEKDKDKEKEALPSTDTVYFYSSFLSNRIFLILSFMQCSFTVEMQDLDITMHSLKALRMLNGINLMMNKLL